mmetsp:Transcript_13406/g.20123  ORF Transcript_13406/g.20123 Transcript_13406/m.20123 type:complete len:493 (+) Transcript_13406:118-1596(+)
METKNRENSLKDGSQISELNSLCAQQIPDMKIICQKVRDQPSLLFPPVHCSEENNCYVPYTYPLQQAANTEREDKTKDLQLFKFLLEEGLKLSINESTSAYDHIEKGGLIATGRSKSEPFPLTTLGLKNKFHIFEYLSSMVPSLLSHQDIHTVCAKCIYFDNQGAIPRLLKLFPSFLKNDMNMEVPKQILVHSAIFNSDIETFRYIVETGILQVPEEPRGIIKGEVLQALISRRYIGGLSYLMNRQPPLMVPSDVLDFGLIGYLIVSDGRQFRYEEADSKIFRLLLELEPQSILKRVGPKGHLPIHIFCEHIMNETKDDSEFYGLLEMVLELGMEHKVGDKVGVLGYGGIFEPCNGTIPAKALHRFIRKMGERDEESAQYSFLEAAVRCTTERDWIRNHLIPDVLSFMEPSEASQRNSDGRLPIHYCISDCIVNYYCIETLLALNESVIGEIDPLTGLAPSLLAAAASHHNCARNHLSVIYELLRKHPLSPL